MPVEVRIPTILRTYTGGEKAVDATGASLSALIDDLEANHPGLKDRLVEVFRGESGVTGRGRGQGRGGRTGRERDGRLAGSGGVAAALSASAASARSTAVASCGSRPAA